MAYPEPIQRVILEFAKLPGIGEKTAERLTFWLINHPKDEAVRLSAAIKELKETIRLCRVCCNVCLKELCDVCSAPQRDPAVVAVVEETRDLWQIESADCYRGVYHVLHGRIAPLDGVGPSDITAARLVERVRRGGVSEVILATNPTVEGDATAHYLQGQLAGLPVKITRIARGLPVGSTMEYASRSTISDAMKGRQDFTPRKV
jgi:recombination protein RecR